MKIISIFIFFIFNLVITNTTLAAAPTCQLNGNSDPYCSYTGTVKRIYINSGGLILIYFDTPLVLSDATGLGINATNINAAAYLVSDNPEFAKLFYSTALAAQVSGRQISMQMRDTKVGYLKFDRIWLYE